MKMFKLIILSGGLGLLAAPSCIERIEEGLKEEKIDVLENGDDNEDGVKDECPEVMLPI